MNIKFRDELLKLQFGRYKLPDMYWGEHFENLPIMISMQLNTSGDYPEPYMTASFNPVEPSKVGSTLKGQTSYIAIKDLSENEGIEKALLDAGIISEDKLVGKVPAGYCEGNVYEINKEFLGE